VASGTLTSSGLAIFGILILSLTHHTVEVTHHLTPDTSHAVQITHSTFAHGHAVVVNLARHSAAVLYTHATGFRGILYFQARHLGHTLSLGDCEVEGVAGGGELGEVGHGLFPLVCS
jgi:hypothetical protein